MTQGPRRSWKPLKKNQPNKIIMKNLFLFVLLFIGITINAQSKVYAGNNPYGTVLVNVKEGKVFSGNNPYGNQVGTIKDGKFYYGRNPYGEVAAVLRGNQVIAGRYDTGRVIAFIDGNKIRQGNTSTGKVIGTFTNGGLVTGLAGAVFILLL